MPRITTQETGSANLCAFLDCIAWSEGTAGHGDDGYDVVVGYGRFHGYSDHPRRLVPIPGLGIKSSAAGRYQFLIKTWDWVAATIALDTFIPINQDRAALFLIDYRGATEAVIAGEIEEALHLCRKEWASLPGAGYGQHERALDDLVAVYKRAGGRLADDTPMSSDGHGQCRQTPVANCAGRSRPMSSDPQSWYDRVEKRPPGKGET